MELGTGKWTPGGCGSGGDAGVTSPGTGGLAGTPSTSQTWEITPAGEFTGTASITSLSPVCDIRAFGAVLDGITDIGSAVQACINQSTSAPGNSYTILFPCTPNNWGQPSCYWDNPSALTFTSGVSMRFMVQGGIKLGSTLVADGRENWYSDAGGGSVQFQPGTPATIIAPSVYGTIGTAITSTNTGVTITPTFTNGNLAHLPPGSAITIAETATASATATRVNSSYGYGTVTLVLAAKARFLPLETFSVSGCSDSSFDITGGAILQVDYSAAGGEQVTYQQTTTTPSTATGCSVTSFDEDKYESTRVMCANGVSYGSYGYTCGTGQIAIVPNHTHSAAAQFGAVAVSPAFNTTNGQTWSGISIQDCMGMCFWQEIGSDMEMWNVSTGPAKFIAAGSMESTASWVSWIHHPTFLVSGYGQTACQSGRMHPAELSFRAALRCRSFNHRRNSGAQQHRVRVLPN